MQECYGYPYVDSLKKEQIQIQPQKLQPYSSIYNNMLFSN